MRLLNVIHEMFFDFWNLAFEHVEEFFEVFDISHLLIVTLSFRGVGMEFELREEGIDELPVGTIRNFDLSDFSQFIEVVE